jgi:hypothetical protein
VSGVGTYVLSLVLVVTVGSYMRAVSVLGAASTTAALVLGWAHVRVVDLVYRAVCVCSGLYTLVLSLGGTAAVVVGDMFIFNLSPPPLHPLYCACALVRIVGPTINCIRSAGQSRAVG